MNIKLLFLASAAALMAVPAVAADAVSADALAPEPAIASETSSAVQACSTVGVGYFVIPGSETCIGFGGQIETQFGYVDVTNKFNGRKVGGFDKAQGSVEAYFDVNTHTDSEFGAITSKIRIGVQHGPQHIYFADQDADTDFGIEQAYVGVGPAYVGYTESLFDKRIGYGEFPDVETLYGDYMNSLAVGAKVPVGGGWYVGGAVESGERGLFVEDYNSNSVDPDYVARFGIDEQAWGNSDLSVMYSSEDNFWAVKSTTDYNVFEGTTLRGTAAYSDVNNYDNFLVAGSVMHGFTDTISGFGGVGYGKGKVETTKADALYANAGVIFTPVEGFSVSGELGYVTGEAKEDGDKEKTKGYNALFKLVRSF